jgi:hypothetical protein
MFLYLKFFILFLYEKIKTNKLLEEFQILQVNVQKDHFASEKLQHIRTIYIEPQ